MLSENVLKSTPIFFSALLGLVFAGSSASKLTTPVTGFSAHEVISLTDLKSQQQYESLLEKFDSMQRTVADQSKTTTDIQVLKEAMSELTRVTADQVVLINQKVEETAQGLQKSVGEDLGNFEQLKSAIEDLRKEVQQLKSTASASKAVTVDSDTGGTTEETIVTRVTSSPVYYGWKSGGSCGSSQVAGSYQVVSRVPVAISAPVPAPVESPVVRYYNSPMTCDPNDPNCQAGVSAPVVYQKQGWYLGKNLGRR